MARPSGSRKLRAKPPATLTMSPRRPTPATSSRRSDLHASSPGASSRGLLARASSTSRPLRPSSSSSAPASSTTAASVARSASASVSSSTSTETAARRRLGRQRVAQRPLAPVTAATPARALGHRALGVGQQHELAGRLDGHGQRPLVLGAVARHPARADLAAVAHVLAQHGDVLVVDPLDLVPAQRAGLLLDPPAEVLGGAPGGRPAALVVACHQKGSSSNP